MAYRFYSKYKAKKTEVDGHIFDSKKEANYYIYLKNCEDVVDIELQPEFLLQEKYRYNGKAIRPIKYRADFRVKYSDGTEKIIDVKGMLTDVYKIKKKLLLFKYPDIIFEEV